jgi:hypothetical protein
VPPPTTAAPTPAAAAMRPEGDCNHPAHAWSRSRAPSGPTPRLAPTRLTVCLQRGLLLWVPVPPLLLLGPPAGAVVAAVGRGGAIADQAHTHPRCCCSWVAADAGLWCWTGAQVGAWGADGRQQPHPPLEAGDGGAAGLAQHLFQHENIPAGEI